MLESEIEKYLVHRVKEVGGLCLKLEVNGLRGFPDRTCLWPSGHTEFVEVKKPGGRLSKQQLAWKKTLNEQGFCVFVVATKEQVDAYMEM